MTTLFPFFSYSLDGYIEAKMYLRNKKVNMNYLRGFQLIELANNIKETEEGI